MKLTGLMLSERSHTEKNLYCGSIWMKQVKLSYDEKNLTGGGLVGDEEGAPRAS